MRMRERGIGNLPFIAVLVLFVVAVALFFVARSEADQFRAQVANKQDQIDKLVNTARSAQSAYDAWFEVSGLADNTLQRNDDNFPAPDDIKNTVRTWLMSQVEEIKTKGTAEIQNRVYQVPEGGSAIEVVKGDKTRIVLYGTPMVKETITFRGVIAPLGQQFEYAANAIEANNQQFESEYETYQTRLRELDQKIQEIQQNFRQEVSAKAQQYDTEKQRADTMQDQVNSLSATNDQIRSEKSQLETQFQRAERDLNRKITALENRIVTLQEKKEIALKEDPKDGEVLYADPRLGLVFINRGRNFNVSRGMKFTVWRTGRGGVRENIAVIRVIKVEQTRSTCNVLQVVDRRVPVAQGQNISNPFYDPFKKLQVYIYGDLRYYPNDIAKRRLAEAGAEVVSELDIGVDVIVLGEPPVTVGGEDVEDEGEIAAVEMRRTAEREKRLREVQELATSIGAVVVTEDVLRTFISY